MGPTSLVYVRDANHHWYSRFDIDTSVVPGIGRRIQDNVTGDIVYRMIYWEPGLYQIRTETDSIQVEIRGNYLFGQPGAPVAAMTERISAAPALMENDEKAEPYFKTTFFENVSDAYALAVLSFPAMRFY